MPFRSSGSFLLFGAIPVNDSYSVLPVPSSYTTRSLSTVLTTWATRFVVKVLSPVSISFGDRGTLFQHDSFRDYDTVKTYNSLSFGDAIYWSGSLDLVGSLLAIVSFLDHGTVGER